MFTVRQIGPTVSHLLPATRGLEQDIDQDQVDEEDEDGKDVHEDVPAGPVGLPAGVVAEGGGVVGRHVPSSPQIASLGVRNLY